MSHTLHMIQAVHRHGRLSSAGIALLSAVIALVLATPAAAVEVQDLVRLKGSETNALIGMGLVVGLDGTGDGGDFLPAMRPLAQLTNRLLDPNTTPIELEDAQNVALVALEVKLPATGVREGDTVDIHVSSIGPADSLRGGRLILAPLTGPRPNSPIFAYAQGAVVLQDAEVPTGGVIRGGAQLTRDVMSQYIDQFGRITLVINQDVASWPMANNLASLINELLAPEGPRLAKAIDQKNVVIDVPIYEREDPASFISRVLSAYINPTLIKVGSRVVINQKTGTIIVTGDVQISPVLVMHEGLTVTTVTPEPQPNPFNPVTEERPAVAIDPQDEGGTKLADLLAAFNQMKVSSDDRIAIIREIARSGKLHAQLIIE